MFDDEGPSLSADEGWRRPASRSREADVNLFRNSLGMRAFSACP